MRSISEVTSKDGGHQRDLTAFILSHENSRGKSSSPAGNYYFEPVKNEKTR
jgi:hypothetical protein